jgi:uncharacterized protein (DUF1800 family)
MQEPKPRLPLPRVQYAGRRLDAAWPGAALGIVALAFFIVAPLFAAHPPREFAGRLPITGLSEDEAIFHALNRLAFGPRPGEIERVRRMGLENWVRQQLHPDDIDDRAVAARLERFPTLAMSSAQLLEEYPNPVMAARRSGVSPEEYRRELERRREVLERARAQREAGQPVDPEAARMIMQTAREFRGPQRILAELSAAKLTRAIYSERQLQEILTDFWFNHFNVFANKGASRWLITSYERDVIRPNALGKFRELLGATASSPAMLFYLDNWMSAAPEAYARLERELRQRQQRFNRRFGGMMNPVRNAARGMPNVQQRLQQRMPRGLNENYARELMELHTLGVDGGYTQADVVEVARAFTGWTLRLPRQSPEFVFEERLHDRKTKTLLGTKIERGGRRDGEAVLDLLARHPSTARHIALKLARRFVSDAPPDALVARMAEAFRRTDGDLRAVVETMIYSPEFWSREAYRAKIKKPFELVASAARAAGADVMAPVELVQWTARIGEALYLCEPPTGYDDAAEAWVNTNSLLNRMNFALALAGGQVRGVRVGLAERLGPPGENPREVLERALAEFLAGQVTEQTRAVLVAQMGDPQMMSRATGDGACEDGARGQETECRAVNAAVIAGLVLGSPEFQRK